MIADTEKRLSPLGLLGKANKGRPLSTLQDAESFVPPAVSKGTMKSMWAARCARSSRRLSLAWALALNGRAAHHCAHYAESVVVASLRATRHHELVDGRRFGKGSLCWPATVSWLRSQWGTAADIECPPWVTDHPCWNETSHVDSVSPVWFISCRVTFVMPGLRFPAVIG